jgi:hypothetical protein
MPDLAHHPKTIEYFVNGEVQETTEHKLTVATILANAGFDPPDEWLLQHGKHKYEDQQHVVDIHKDEQFTATFTGVTPTS